MGKDFDLVDEPWIMVDYMDGSRGTLGLRGALADSRRVRRLSGDMPGQELPVLRLLLAVLSRVYQPEAMASGPEAVWSSVWDAGHFDMDAVDAYLGRWRSRLGLFGGERPFMQVAGLRYSSGRGPSGLPSLVADLPGSSRQLFSMRALGMAKAITPAEAARWLLFTQAYDLSGIKGGVAGNPKTKSGKSYPAHGVPDTGWLGDFGAVVFSGRDLFETLMLNWRPEGDARDLPAWERDPTLGASTREPDGPVDLMAWQSRRMLLHRDAEGMIDGVVATHGDAIRPVEAFGKEPMAMWHQSTSTRRRKGDPPTPAPLPVRDPQYLWACAPSMLRDDGEMPAPGVVTWLGHMIGMHATRRPMPAILTIGVQSAAYGPHASSWADLSQASLRVRAGMLDATIPGRQEAMGAVADTTRRARSGIAALVECAERIRRASGSRSSHLPDEMRHLRDDAYMDLAGTMLRGLEGMDPEDDTKELAARWRTSILRELRGVADRYADDYASGSVFREYDDGTRHGRHMSSARALDILHATLTHTLTETQKETE